MVLSCIFLKTFALCDFVTRFKGHPGSLEMTPFDGCI